MTRYFKKFASREDGSATVEAAIWMPIFFALLLAVVDISMYLYSMNRAWATARDVTRQVAVGDIKPEEARGAVVASLGRSENVDVVVTISETNRVEFAMSLPNSMLLVSYFDLSALDVINVSYVMRSELPAEKTPEAGA